MKKLNILLIPLGVVFLLGVTAWLSWVDYNKSISLPSLNIAPYYDGFKRYYDEKNKYPTSLEEAVVAGYLPEKANFYASYVKDKEVSPRVVSYKLCEINFDLSNKDEPIAIIPKEHFKKYFILNRRRDVRLSLGRK